MNKRLVLLAALVVAVWAGINYWPEKKKEEKTDPAWHKLNPAKITKIEQKAADSFVLDMRNGEWFITLSGDRKTAEPLRASLPTVEAVANFVNGSMPLRRLGPLAGEKAKDFGLDKPKASITFTSETAWTIEVGDKNPTNDGIYAKSSLEPDECLLLAASYLEQLNRKPDHYFDLRLADFPAETVAKVRVRSAIPGAAPEEWEIERRETGFAFTAPASSVGKSVASQEADSYLRSLAMAKGKQLLLPAPPIPDAAATTISVWRKGVDSPVVFELYQFPADFAAPGLAGQFFCRSNWQKGILTLDKNEVPRLVRSAFSLRDRTALKLDASGLKRMKIIRTERQGQPLAEVLATRSEKGWTDQGTKKAMSGMDMLMWQLADLKFESEPASTLPAEAKCVLEWYLYKDGDQPATTLKFFRDPALSKGRCWLTVDNGENKYPVDDQLLDELLRDAPAENMPPALSGMNQGQGMGLPPGMQLLPPELALPPNTPPGAKQ